MLLRPRRRERAFVGRREAADGQHAHRLGGPSFGDEREALAGRDDSVFALDSEAGTITFGDGIRGRIPEPGRRIRVDTARVGGGKDGNVAAGSLTRVENPIGVDGRAVSAKLKVQQSLATDGGDDAESLADAERRIPALFRDRDRAVTAEDYKRLYLARRETLGDFCKRLGWSYTINYTDRLASEALVKVHMNMTANVGYRGGGA